MNQITCVFIGDGTVGKTCFLSMYIRNRFPTNEMTELQAYDTQITLDNQQINLKIWDNSGAEDLEMLRTPTYKEANVFVVCFSLVNPTSLKNVRNKWVPEVRKHCRKTPLLLVGMQSDVRDKFLQNRNENRRNEWEPIPTSKGEEMKTAINAKRYIECSAKTRKNLKEVFETVIQVVKRQRSGRMRDCCEVA
jgi:small GTP-binding protein